MHIPRENEYISVHKSLYSFTYIQESSGRLISPSASSPGQSGERALTLCISLFFFVILLNNFPLQKWPFYRDCAATGLPCSPTHTQLARVKVAAKYEKYEMMRRFDSDGSGNEHVWRSKRDNGGVSFVAFVTLNMSAC